MYKELKFCLSRKRALSNLKMKYNNKKYFYLVTYMVTILISVKD